MAVIMKRIAHHLTSWLAVAAWIGLGTVAEAAPDRVTVAWDPNPEPDIAGYHVYYGIVGSGTTNKVSPGTLTQQQVISLQAQTQYWFYVTAFNAAGLESDPSDVLAYTTPANLAPMVSLGGDRIAIIPDVVHLSATASDDYLEANALTTTWSQLAGPATVGVAGGTKFKPAFQFTVPGAYTFRVTVNDGYHTASDEVQVHAYQQLTETPPGAVAPDIQGIFPTFDGLIIQWNSAPNAHYRIAHKSDLNETTWTIIADNVAAQGPTSYWVDYSGQLGQQGFYAIFQMP